MEITVKGQLGVNSGLIPRKFLKSNHSLSKYDDDTPKNRMNVSESTYLN
jgi:hypothetical protein